MHELFDEIKIIEKLCKIFISPTQFIENERNFSRLLLAYFNQKMHMLPNLGRYI